LYFGKLAEGDYVLRMQIDYSAEDWLFIDEYIVKADGERFSIPVAPFEVKRDIGYSRIYESCDLLVSGVVLKAVQAMIHAGEVKLRYGGDRVYSDRTISDEELSAMRDMFAAYQELGGTLVQPVTEIEELELRSI
jgi:hypothetical protein